MPTVQGQLPCKLDYSVTSESPMSGIRSKRIQTTPKTNLFLYPKSKLLLDKKTSKNQNRLFFTQKVSAFIYLRVQTGPKTLVCALHSLKFSP
jgi:hypothetical protein